MTSFGRTVIAGTSAALLVLGTTTVAHADDDMASCPRHAQHMQEAEAAHLEAVNKRGDQGMGFKQSQTVHHFTLLPDGGAIEVSVTQPGDATSRRQIQQHLQHIAQAFAAGDFRLPMFIHAQTPPGVPTMRKRKTQIAYAYEATPSGGRVRISTKDARALRAVHAFLRFQIADHQTGDRTEVSETAVH